MPNDLSKIALLLKECGKKTNTFNIKEVSQVIYMEDPSLTKTLALLKQSIPDPEYRWEILTTLKDQKPVAKDVPEALQKALLELGVHLVLQDKKPWKYQKDIMQTLLTLKDKFQTGQLELTEEEKKKLKEMSIGATLEPINFVKIKMEQEVINAVSQAINENGYNTPSVSR